MLEKPAQISEIRVRGRGGGKPPVLQIKESLKLTVDVEDVRGKKERSEFGVDERDTTDLHEKYLEAPWWFAGMPLIYRRIETKEAAKIMRVRTGQVIHGGTIYIRPENNEIYPIYIYFKGRYEKVCIKSTDPKEVLKLVKAQFDRRAASRREPRLWRGPKRIKDDDLLGDKVLTLDWTDRKRTCKIRVGEDVYKTVVDRTEDIYRVIAEEYGTANIYICDEDGDPVDYDTEFDRAEFTSYQAYGRIMKNRMYWPEEDTLKKVIQRTGREIYNWIWDQLGCDFDIQVAKDGLTPVRKNVDMDELYEENEFVTRSDGEMDPPEEKDWEGNILINLDYRVRRSPDIG
jgi:hypothetical protein